MATPKGKSRKKRRRLSSLRSCVVSILWTLYYPHFNISSSIFSLFITSLCPETCILSLPKLGLIKAMKITSGFPRNKGSLNIPDYPSSADFLLLHILFLILRESLFHSFFVPVCFPVGRSFPLTSHVFTRAEFVFVVHDSPHE